MSTLIVRDATLAVNGAPETRGEAAEHIDQRVATVAAFDAAGVAECLQVLVPAAGTGEDADPEVLLALTIVGLACPELAKEAGLATVAVGRRLAARLEQEGEAPSALAVLDRLRDIDPTHDALERDHDAILRRLGMVRDLADRYYQRAERLFQEGRIDEAEGWLREVLLVDASRTDAARLLRDIRLTNEAPRFKRRMPKGPFVAAMLTTFALTAIVVHERRVSEEFEALPPQRETLESMRARLDAVESFVSRHPVWHGTFGVLAERSELRVEVGQLEEMEARRNEARVVELAELADKAELVRQRAYMRVEGYDFDKALEDLREALEIAPDDWPERERVERDIASVLEYLDEEGSR